MLKKRAKKSVIKNTIKICYDISVSIKNNAVAMDFFERFMYKRRSNYSLSIL